MNIIILSYFSKTRECFLSGTNIYIQMFKTLQILKKDIGKMQIIQNRGLSIDEKSQFEK